MLSLYKFGDLKKRARGLYLDSLRPIFKTTTRESIEYLGAKEFKCDTIENRYETYVKYVCALSMSHGLWLEFGVATGKTTKQYVSLMNSKQKPLYGFDSFQGLPEKWARHKAGAFSTNGEVPKIEGAEIIEGLFEDTLPHFMSNSYEMISVLIIDCDIYSSTKTVLDYSKSKLQKGSIIIFDEFHNGSGLYSSWKEHEFRAWKEFSTEYQIGYEWLAYVSNGEQAALRITTI